MVPWRIAESFESRTPCPLARNSSPRVDPFRSSRTPSGMSRACREISACLPTRSSRRGSTSERGVATRRVSPDPAARKSACCNSTASRGEISRICCEPGPGPGSCSPAAGMGGRAGSAPCAATAPARSVPDGTVPAGTVPREAGGCDPAQEVELQARPAVQWANQSRREKRDICGKLHGVRLHGIRLSAGPNAKNGGGPREPPRRRFACRTGPPRNCRRRQEESPAARLRPRWPVSR